MGIFSLQPFAPNGNFPSLEIKVQLSRQSNSVALSYSILGPVDEIEIPPLASTPLRKSGLWEETCVEFFLAVNHSGRYWETNLSPSGHWNVYRFSDYREGMQEEAAFTSLPLRVGRREDSFVLDVELDLNRIIPPQSPLHVGISAVIRLRSNQRTYWALIHPGQKPDFHHRDSFIARL